MYRLEGGRALVQTVDFFTPIVDDPYVYGQIAAANALSDVYAMGATPLTALAIAGFPKDLDPGVLRQIFAGGLDTLREAGVALLGGHTVQDTEIKFGYAVTGDVDPERILANSGARPGDALILTKALGTGIIATALKFGRVSGRVVDAAVRSMTALNRDAAQVLVRAGGAVHGCTDVTGFGLIGHAAEMAAASGCAIEVDAARVPVLDGALSLAAGNLPGGGRTNRDHFGALVTAGPGVTPGLIDLFYDPQTSGGLLAAVDPAEAAHLLEALASAGVAAAAVGRCVAGAPGIRLV